MEKEGATAVVVLLCLVVVMELPEASATRYMVGGNVGWTSNVNYTIWAQDKHFYNGDWLCKLTFLSLLSDPLSIFFFCQWYLFC